MVQFFKKARAGARFEDMIQQARSIWFKETDKQIQGGRKCRRYDYDDEEQEITHAPTIEWGMGDGMVDIQIYVDLPSPVCCNIELAWSSPHH